MLVNQKAQIGFEGRKERFKVTVDEEVTVRFTLQNCFAYKGKGPVLEVEAIRKISQPMKPVIGSVGR